MRGEFAGRLNPTITTDAEGRQIVSFTAEKGEEAKLKELAARAFTARQTGKDKLSVSVADWRPKRTKTANAYAWELMGKIAEKLKSTAEEIYREEIRKVGVFEIVPIRDDALEEWCAKWRARGLGWVAEPDRASKFDGYTNVRCWFGSSVYNGKEMARLLDEIIEDCKDLDVETLPPEKLAAMKFTWESRYVQEQEK